jgi:hypothetical protein
MESHSLKQTTNKRSAMEQQEEDAPAEGFGKAERAADKRSNESGNRDSLLQVVLLCMTSFTSFWFTC